jgi:hypothetical protein
MVMVARTEQGGPRQDAQARVAVAGAVMMCTFPIAVRADHAHIGTGEPATFGTLDFENRSVRRHIMGSPSWRLSISTSATTINSSTAQSRQGAEGIFPSRFRFFSRSSVTGSRNHFG